MPHPNKHPELVARKAGMTTIFEAQTGKALAVTVLELLPLTVTQLKTKATDGYEAVQFGYIEAKPKHLTKAEAGHTLKNNLPRFRKLREVRMQPGLVEAFALGQVVEPSFLSEGAMVDVIGTSKGKGFQGATKRWGFARGPMAHGSKSHRLPGSIGAGTTPGRVYKGTKMAGNMGNKRIVQPNLPIVKILTEKNVVMVKGAVPGANGGLVVIRSKAS
ncbi:MAG: 50S ribosomal protein L3 [Vampirovibrionales bacterium]|nr:50S ribosomal protein L3 [Vampirovibrionales bacterium]